jgi:hypothetical protein
MEKEEEDPWGHAKHYSVRRVYLSTRASYHSVHYDLCKPKQAWNFRHQTAHGKVNRFKWVLFGHLSNVLYLLDRHLINGGQKPSVRSHSLSRRKFANFF